MAAARFAEEPATSDDEASLSPFFDDPLADPKDGQEETFLNGSHGRKGGQYDSLGYSIKYRALHALERALFHLERAGWGQTAYDYFIDKPRRLSRRTFALIAGIILTLFIVLFASHSKARIRDPFHLTSSGSNLKRPENVTIYGIVFYGRQATVEILDCYLQRNLARNGGWLDEIHFMINTDKEDDLAWIEQKVKEVEGYKPKYLPEGKAGGNDFEVVWRAAVEPGCLYVKFDDDLLWFSDGAVEELVTTLVAHPEAFIILGNLINSAALGWVHHHLGAIHSYLPELSPPEDPSPESYGPKAWRPSALPTYTAPDGGEIEPFPNNVALKSPPEIGVPGGPPYPHHRWLPLRDNDSLLERTPMWETEYSPYSHDWLGWQLGAQQQYSLFSNIESDTLPLYHFGHPTTGLWNMRYMHANINFIALWSDSVLENLPFFIEEDDEAHFTMSLPRKLGKQVLVQTRAIASHIAFGPQGLIYDTDLLERYRAYANERVCGRGKEVPWRERETEAMTRTKERVEKEKEEEERKKKEGDEEGEDGKDEGEGNGKGEKGKGDEGEEEKEGEKGKDGGDEKEEKKDDEER